MLFPKFERVKFEKCPLVEVVCQIRFPAILSIDSNEPAKFQDAIRELYPVFEETIEQQQQFTFENPAPGLLIQPTIKSNTSKNYKFTSVDGTSWINLTRNFISLTTNKYSRWEEFCEQLVLPFRALNDIYKPAFFERIGLRYIDVFCRTGLGLSGWKWSDLFQLQALGLLACEDELSNSVMSYNMINEVLLEDAKSILRLNTSLVVQQGMIFQDKETEKCLMIDGDYFTTERFSIYDEVIEKLDFLHERSTRLIRWLIKPRLYNALEPKEL